MEAPNKKFHRIFLQVGAALIFTDGRTDRQTDRQTADRLADITKPSGLLAFVRTRLERRVTFRKIKYFT
jgi:hypothetical protein